MKKKNRNIFFFPKNAFFHENMAASIQPNEAFLHGIFYFSIDFDWLYINR